MQTTTTLSDGTVMPMLGLGTWKSAPGKTGDAVKAAIRAGYRLIDTANDYGNEAEIGRALADLLASGEVSRDELFIQAKLWNSNHRPHHVRPDLEATLRDLQLTYVDSFIIHWPQACPATGTHHVVYADGNNCPGVPEERTMFPVDEARRYLSDNESHYVETWHAMEDLVDAGLCRTIGLSNFNVTQVREVKMAARKYQPTLVQSECHPYLQQKDTVDFCKLNGIVFQAYSPLGSRDRPWAKPGDIELLDDPALTEIAQKYGKTTAQVVIRWHLQRGVSAIPKSVTPSRIAENAGVFDFELSPEDMASFDRFNKGWRHLLWPETSMHPDYPFKDEIPHGYKIGVALGSTTKSSV